jgi:hypothetical protein
MKRFLAALILLILGAALAAQTVSPSQSSPRAKFVTCDIIIDSGQTPLAAWQIDFHGTVDGGTVELVGVGGGSDQGDNAKPFAAPPFYDPEALAHDRIVIAAFSTAKPELLPTGSTRVARLHLRITGDNALKPELSATLITAADSAGVKITPTVRASLGDTP